MEHSRIWNPCVEKESPAIKLAPLGPDLGPFLCSLISFSYKFLHLLIFKKKKGKELEIMTSEEGLFFFKIRSNCFLALLERQALSSPAQGLAIYFSMAPTSLSFFNRHVPRDPSPGHYPASGGVGWKNSFSLSLQHLRPGSLICQARQEGGFLRGMTSEPSLWRAHRHLIKLQLQRWGVRICFLGDSL